MSSQRGEENIIKINIIKIKSDEDQKSIIKSNKEKYEVNSLIYKNIINFKKSIFFMSLFLIIFFIGKIINNKISSNIIPNPLINDSNLIKLRLLNEEKEEESNKINVINLKFQVKNPKNPVLLFNKSNEEFINSIQQIELGNKIYTYVSKLKKNQKSNTSLITNEFKFGFSGKYKVKIYLKKNLNSLDNIFSGCSQLYIADFTQFISDDVISMSGLFSRCLRLKYVEFGNFKTEKVVDMSYMFNDCKSMMSLNLSSFDTSKVVYMNGMFSGCEEFLDLNLDNFLTYNVQRMDNMFEGCDSLLILNISHFDTSKVENMSNMFSRCSALPSLNISHFKTSSVRI